MALHINRFDLVCLALILFLSAYYGCSSEDEGESTTNAGVVTVEVQINELSSSGDDPIELYNAGDADVDISGWLLTDSVDEDADASFYDTNSDNDKLVLGAGTILSAGGYLVINKGDEAGMHPFGLGENGDTVSLFNAAGKLVEQVSYGDGQAESSYCFVDSSWQVCEPTFGSANKALLCGNGSVDDGEVCDGDAGSSTCAELDGFIGGTLGCFDDCSGYDTSNCERAAFTCDTDVRLNEVCHKASKCGTDDTTGDWLELHNTGDDEADISGCYIRIYDEDGVTLRLGPTQFGSVPGFETASISPGGYFIIDNNKAIMDAAKGNSVEFIGEDGVTVRNSLITSSAYQDGADACSIDEEGDIPTPGAENACAVVPCGNGVVDEGEFCDGDAGSTTCVELGGFIGGTLGCKDDCSGYDISSCELASVPTCDTDVRLNEVCHKDFKCGTSDTTGDWLELYNGGGDEADISGCYLRIYEEDGVTIRLGPVQLASVLGFQTASIVAGGYFIIDDNKSLMNAADDNLVEFIGADGTTVYNSLTTSSAHQDSADACSIDEDGDTPTPGAPNICL